MSIYATVFKNIRKAKSKILTLHVKRNLKTCGEGLKVNGFTSVTNNTHLGKNCNFNGMIMTGSGKVVIGDNFHSGTQCRVITSFHNYDTDDEIPYGSESIHKSVVIEDNVWVGDRVLILGGVTLGEGCIIQAGSTVCKDVPKYAIAGGHPAVVFKYRDIEHYNELKQLKRFH